MTKEKMTTLDNVREQLQEDIICIMDSHFGEVEYVEEVKDHLCQAVVDNVNKIIEGQPPSPLVLELYHGRIDPKQAMQDWGSQGPLLYVDVATVTYMSEALAEGRDSIRIKFTGQKDLEFLHKYMFEDMFYYDGVYYGDFSFQPVENDRQPISSGIRYRQGQEPELFNLNKARKK